MNYKMWPCPYCKGKTYPITIDEVREEIKRRLLIEIKRKTMPIIVKCRKCGKVWVSEIG